MGALPRVGLEERGTPMLDARTARILAKENEEDIAKDKTVATITWTFAAGNASARPLVDDSWEGNHEMGID